MQGRQGRLGRGRPGAKRGVERWLQGKGPQQHRSFALAAARTVPIGRKTATSSTKLATIVETTDIAVAAGTHRQPSPQQRARQVAKEQLQQEAKDRRYRHQRQEQQQRQQRWSATVAERRGTRSQIARTKPRSAAYAARLGTCRRPAARETKVQRPLQRWTRPAANAPRVGFAQTPHAMPPNFCQTAQNARHVGQNG